MTDMTPDRYTLLADIGGTNTRVALAEDGRLLPHTIARFANAGRASFYPILSEYMAKEGVRDLAGACIAVAGPVSAAGDSAEMTNLSWVIEADEVARVTGAETVAILNDLQAQGHALGHLPEGATRTLIEGAPAEAGASRLVVGVGTGFNAAPVHEAPGGRFVAASECGHAALPVQDARDMALMEFVHSAHGFAAVEDVLSGRGFERVYAFVTSEAGARADIPAAQIMAAMQAGDPLAQATGQLFVRMLGMAVGDLALIHLPFGGLYLCGGVARAFTPWLEQFGFAEAFRAKGRFSVLMAEFPVHVIEDDYAALTGCATYLQALRGRK